MGTRIEHAPFSSDWTKIGPSSHGDSVVGLITSHCGDYYVAKWNRRFLTVPDTLMVCTFIKRSLILYESALGKEYVVPTWLVAGEKQDHYQIKAKVYLFQQYVLGWNGQDLPEDLRCSAELRDKWGILYSRLSALYTSAREVNRQFPANSPEIFPITLTVGDSRVKALEGGESCVVPRTPNILISQDLDLVLCDFGKYTLWRPEMEKAYSMISEAVQDNLSAFVSGD